jgi:hypothetical protein
VGAEPKRSLHEWRITAFGSMIEYRELVSGAVPEAQASTGSLVARRRRPVDFRNFVRGRDRLHITRTCGPTLVLKAGRRACRSHPSEQTRREQGGKTRRAVVPGRDAAPQSQTLRLDAQPHGVAVTANDGVSRSGGQRWRPPVPAGGRRPRSPHLKTQAAPKARATRTGVTDEASRLHLNNSRRVTKGPALTCCM